MQAINATKNIPLAQSVQIAENFFSRLQGLIGTAELSEGNALLILPCSSIHTWFMKYPIDVIFLDAENRIIKIMERVPPNRFGPLVRGARAALELPAGVCSSTGTGVGDIIQYNSWRVMESGKKTL